MFIALDVLLQQIADYRAQLETLNERAIRIPHEIETLNKEGDKIFWDISAIESRIAEIEHAHQMLVHSMGLRGVK